MSTNTNTDKEWEKPSKKLTVGIKEELSKPERPEPSPTSPIMKNEKGKKKNISVNIQAKEAFDTYHRKILSDLNKPMNQSDIIMYLIKNVKSDALILDPDVKQMFNDFRKRLEKNQGKEIDDNYLITWLIKNR